MLGLLVGIVAGWNVRRLWPTGVLWLLIYPAVAVPVQMLIAGHNRAAFGEAMDWSFATLLASYLIGGAVFAALFLLGFGARRVFGNRERAEPNLDAHN